MSGLCYDYFSIQDNWIEGGGEELRSENRYERVESIKWFHYCRLDRYVSIDCSDCDVAAATWHSNMQMGPLPSGCLGWNKDSASPTVISSVDNWPTIGPIIDRYRIVAAMSDDYFVLMDGGWCMRPVAPKKEKERKEQVINDAGLWYVTWRHVSRRDTPYMEESP